MESILDKKTGSFLRRAFVDTFVNKDHPYFPGIEEGKMVYLHDMFRNDIRRFVELEDVLQWLKALPEGRVYLMWDISSGKAFYENGDDSLEIFFTQYGSDAVLAYTPESLAEDISYDLDIIRKHENYKPIFPDDVYIFDDSFNWYIALTHNELSAGRRVCFSNVKEIPEVSDMTMHTPISLYAKGLHFLGDFAAELAQDACVHGTVHLTLGNTMISSGDITWNAGASALKFLRSLFSDHHAETGEDHMIPCCGHFMIPSDDGRTVTVIGCTNGVDFDVIHKDSDVLIRTENGMEYTVSMTDYRREVISLARQIEAFYSDSPERDIKDEFELDGYKAFRKEFRDLLALAESGATASPVAPPERRFVKKIISGDRLSDLGCYEELIRLTGEAISTVTDPQYYTQAVALRTANGTVYSAVIPNALVEDHSAEKNLLAQLKNDGNTHITEIVCKWIDGSPDIPSNDFREMIRSLHPANDHARILLEGNYSYHTRTVRETMFRIQVDFGDTKFEAYIRSILNKFGRDITDLDMLDITYLDLAFDDFYDITPVRYCKKLSNIHLGEGFLKKFHSDVFAGLNNIEAIAIFNPTADELDTLADLFILKELDMVLFGNAVSLPDLNKFTALESLSIINFTGHPFSLRNIRKLHKLKKLRLTSDHTDDDILKELSELTEIQFN